MYLAAVVFAGAGVSRLLLDADTRAFAHLTMAAALVLVAVRDRRGAAGSRFWYVPEVLLLLAVLQYAYHFLGV